LGGLVVKQAFLLASNSLDESHRKVLGATSGIIFLGTPHTSSITGISKILQYSIPSVRGKSSPHIAKIASQIGRIQEAFQEFLTQKLPKLQIISFFEEIPVPGFGLVRESHLEMLSRSDGYRLLMNRAQLLLQLRFFQSAQTTR